MNFFKKLFGKANKSRLDINHLLLSKDLNRSIIEIDNYICELCKWGQELEKLNEPQKNFYFNQTLEREVNNGGFELFFANSSGQYAQQTLQSLKLIQAYKTADILERAIKSNFKETMKELDNGFFKYQDNLNNLNIEYIKKNKSSF